MEPNSLIDIKKPVIVIQIQDDKVLKLLTNFESVDDVVDILEEMLEQIANMEYTASKETQNLLNRLH